MVDPGDSHPADEAEWPDFSELSPVPSITPRCDSRLVGKPCEVLVGSPDAQTRAFLAEVLRAHPWSVTLTTSAEELVARLGKEPADLVVVDASFMCEALENALRRRDSEKPRPRIPFAVILSQPTEQEAYDWMARGAAAFLHAPLTEVPADTLTFVLRSALRLFPTADALPPATLRQLPTSEDWIELIAPSHEAALEQFQRFFVMLYGSGLDEELKRLLHLVIGEIGMNAIEWGNRRDASRTVRIGYRFLPDRVMIRIQDEGCGFDPDAIPDPRLDPRGVMEQRRREGKRLGGYGLAMVRGIMDTIRFEANGTVVIMEKRLRFAGRSRSMPRVVEGEAVE